MSEKSQKGKSIEPTPDGHHIIIDGRKWRATNPNLPPEEKEKLVRDLMKARRDVGAALRHKDSDAEENARARPSRQRSPRRTRPQMVGERQI